MYHYLFPFRISLTILLVSIIIIPLLAHADELSTAVYDCCTITTLHVGTDTSTTVALPLSDKECQKRNSSTAHVTAFYTEGTVSDDQRSCIRKSSGASGEWEEIWTGDFIFENEWQSFRTKKNRKLELTNVYHEFTPGRRTLAGKLLAICATDTHTTVER